MVSLDDLHAFMRVAEMGSFTAAGERLSLPKSTVSRRILRLEEALGVQLLHRTTRAVSLTDVGRVVQDRYGRPLEDLAGLEQLVADEGAEPSGALKVSMPGDLGTLFGGAMAAEFGQLHPKVRLELGVTDRLVDLVAEGVDVGLRVYAQGAPDSASLVGRRIGKITGRLFASRDHLEKHGRPTHPRDIQDHTLISFGKGPGRGIVLTHTDGTTAKIPMSRKLVVDNLFVLKDAVKHGAGIGWLPHFLAHDSRLEDVLPEWSSTQAELWIVWPLTRHLAPALRAFVDYAVDRLSEEPWKACGNHTG
jgi:DNA-binding transcriptional LysR family regulator